MERDQVFLSEHRLPFVGRVALGYDDMEDQVHPTESSTPTKTDETYTLPTRRSLQHNTNVLTWVKDQQKDRDTTEELKGCEVITRTTGAIMVLVDGYARVYVPRSQRHSLFDIAHADLCHANSE